MADDGKSNVNDQIALYVLHERVNELKNTMERSDDRNLKLFEQVTANQSRMSERLLTVETNNKHVSDAVIKLQKESSLQTKLLTGILLAAVSALVTVLVKAVLGM